MMLALLADPLKPDVLADTTSNLAGLPEFMTPIDWVELTFPPSTICCSRIFELVLRTLSLASGTLEGFGSSTICFGRTLIEVGTGTGVSILTEVTVTFFGRPRGLWGCLELPRMVDMVLGILSWWLPTGDEGLRFNRQSRRRLGDAENRCVKGVV